MDMRNASVVPLISVVTVLFLHLLVLDLYRACCFLLILPSLLLTFDPSSATFVMNTHQGKNEGGKRT